MACSVDGDRRSCTFADGTVLQERIISIDPELKRVAYTITDSPFGLTFHSASMQIVPEADRSRVVWTTDIQPDALKTQLDPLFDQLFTELVKGLSAE